MLKKNFKSSKFHAIFIALSMLDVKSCVGKVINSAIKFYGRIMRSGSQCV
ncbi:hypothetical protein CAMGR0001_0056 [Campylobacter gracilis RM3268]|uniref:Uncharacterized protein n=1 Tax=Campylobacter gracilis RM3268 TaxID=553220 RepID=C8PI75_9BACT|nr:hypothetical protein CAMGR0001_0056 [Campylobacter gracilis RM3268]